MTKTETVSCVVYFQVFPTDTKESDNCHCGVSLHRKHRDCLRHAVAERSPGVLVWSSSHRPSFPNGRRDGRASIHSQCLHHTWSLFHSSLGSRCDWRDCCWSCTGSCWCAYCRRLSRRLLRSLKRKRSGVICLLNQMGLIHSTHLYQARPRQ